MIIHFNGKAGVGKLTIAKILAEKMNARVIDNHAIIDLATTCHARRTPGYFRMIHKLIDVVLQEISEDSEKRSFIFTNWLSSTNPDDRRRLDSIAEFAQEKNIPFVQIELQCALEENKKRVISPDRNAKGKLTDPDIFEDLYLTSDIYHPETKYRTAIDTTGKTAHETAQAVMAYIRENVRP